MRRVRDVSLSEAIPGSVSRLSLRQRDIRRFRIGLYLGLRARLPRVQGVADAVDTLDGAVAAVYRFASALSPGTGSLRSHVEFNRRGRFDAAITLHDGRRFGVVRQGLALRRRSLYDRLWAIAEYDYTRRPDTILILTPSHWEQGLTTRFCMDVNLSDCYVAVESREALERRDLRLWCEPSFLFGSSCHTLKFVSSQGSPGVALRTESPSRKRASIPRPERMVQAAPTFGISPSEKRTLDLVADHPMIPRGHLSRWLGVSGGGASAR